MKKQLLLGSAFFAAFAIYAQNNTIKQKPSGIRCISKEIAAKFVVEPENAPATKLNTPIGVLADPNAAQEKSASSLAASSINWKLLGGAGNIYGMLLSESQPLQYNAELNAVSFIQRKSASYVGVPANNSGVIVAMISSNGGATFDSTCIWSNSTDAGRYPQGAIYNPAGNTNIANAYIVGSGPTVAGSGFSGNFYASKKLNAFNSTADATPGAQQFFPFATTGSVTNHGWSRCGFTSTDDGVIRSAALLQPDNTTLASLRGYAIAKGVFNAGTFTWSTDTIIPPALLKPSTGDKVLGYAPLMAWNKAGTVGYFVTSGCVATASTSNKGYQPIIYKTTNSGSTWSLLSGINFNSSAMAPILEHLAPVDTVSKIVAPYFSDMDIIVDANDKLHIGATLASQASPDPDSLGYIAQFKNGGELYMWAHTPGNRPYLYDFIGDGTSPWIFVTVDSISSEQAGSETGSNGFNDNPWDATGTNGSKTNNVDTRIQLGRTPDGKYITFTWVESDTNFTPNSRKYNSLPDIKARCMYSGSTIQGQLTQYQVSPTEINVSKVAAGNGAANPNVSSRATMHYMTPMTGSATVTGNSDVQILTPLVVVNSNPFSQLTNNTIWYQSGKLSYFFPPTVSVIENGKNGVSNMFIYPNPSSSYASLRIDLKEKSNVDVTILNALGQVVKTTKAQGQVGENAVNLDLTSLSTGIYMVNIKAGNTTTTKKLIVE